MELSPKMLAWKLKNGYTTFKTKLLLYQALMLNFRTDRELELQLQPSFCLSRIAQVGSGRADADCYRILNCFSVLNN